MDVVRFLSIKHPDRGYTLHRSFEDLFSQTYRTAGAISEHCGWFSTFGAGMTQHSGEVCVQAVDLGDYCASLAQYALQNTSDELLELMFRAWPEGADRRVVEFLTTVKPGKDAPRYVNLTDLKTSMSESKCYDKRWVPVPDNYRGESVADVVALIDKWRTEKAGGPVARYVLERTVLKMEVKEILNKIFQCVIYVNGEDRDAVTAVRACSHLVTSYRERRSADRALSCYLTNTARSSRDAEGEEVTHNA